MKKNKVFVFFALIFGLQLAIPVSIIGIREFASEKGLQGKMKVEGVFYSAIKGTLNFSVSQNINKKGGEGNFTPVHLDENGFIICEDRTAIKPSGAYIDLNIYRTMKSEYDRHLLDFVISENELNRLTLNRMSDLSFDDFYVTVSIYDGEVIFKALWEGNIKLVEFR